MGLLLAGKQLNHSAGRLLELDALRGIAALAVVFFHYSFVIYQFVPNAKPVAFQFEHGHYGVELFFIISGFVIFMSLSHAKNGWDFLASRITRIYPVFWAAVFITYIVGVLFPLNGQEYNLPQLLANLTMLQSYMKIPSIDGVYWSLSYEIGFYICMGLLFVTNKLKYINVLSIFWLLSTAVFHIYASIIPHPLHYLTLINSYAHLFVAGITLYRCWSSSFSVNCVLILLGVIAVQYLQEGMLGALIVASFILLFILIIRGHAGILRHGFLIYLGTISYSLYLIHHMVGFRIIQELQTIGTEPNTALFITVLLMIVTASLMTYIIERPAARHMKKLYQRHKHIFSKTIAKTS